MHILYFAFLAGAYRHGELSYAYPIMRGGDTRFQSEVPGCSGQPHTTIENGGHFLQEDQGEALARVIANWLQSL